MKLLALDTSTDACSVALLIDDEIVQDHRIASQQHAALILPMIDALMASAQLTPRDLDGVIYGRGPGSFTGVRIGVSVTQGIALGADLNVLGVSTMQSVAQGCLRESGDTLVSVSIDARMDEVYFCCYEKDDAALMTPVTAETICPPDEQINAKALQIPDSSSLQQSIKEAAWAGSGAERYRNILQEHFAVPDDRIRVGHLPQAQDLLTLARPLVVKGDLYDPALAEPVYLRNKVAQTTREREAQRSQ